MPVTSSVPVERAACCNLRAVLPASLEAVEGLLAEFGGHCRSVLKHCDCFAAELLLREALTNAVVHGSQNDPARSVRCALRMKIMRGKTHRLIISVRDEGAGFDFRSLRRREAELSACSGRGLEIFRKYATRVRFNAKGNAVTITKDFDVECRCREFQPEESNR